MKNVVCIGAHPLDADLMGGPLLMKYAKTGAKCTMMHVVKGRIEGDVDPKVQKDYQEKLKREMVQAAEIVGAECHMMELDSSNMPNQVEFTQRLVEYFEKEETDLVITHWRGTLHARHYYAYETVTNAVKIMRNKGKSIKLLYGENCEDLIGYIPQANYHMDQEEIDTWFKALNSYSIFNGKINQVPYDNYYRTMGVVRGMENGNYDFYKSYMYPCLVEEV